MLRPFICRVSNEAALADAPPKWEGTVTGKYQWDDKKKSNTDADKDSFLGEDFKF